MTAPLSTADSSTDPQRGLDKWIGSITDRATQEGMLSAILVPVASVLAALLIGAALIVFDGSNPFSVYGAILRGVFTKPRGFSDTATAATPLILIAIGYALAYRARVFTIGGEGQYLVGAVAGTALVTAAGFRDLPRPILIGAGLLAAIVAGAIWSGIAGWLGVRFGASIVISTLMLGFIGDSVLQWAVRDGIRDPDSFIANSRLLGDAELPGLPGTTTHIGFLLALLVVPIAWWFVSRHRAGFRIDALGHNPAALDANEYPSSKIVIGVMLVAGALAGLAGMVEIAGVNGRLGQEASVGFGWDAIIVALLGRLHPVGVLIAGIGMAGLTIGFQSSQRELALPSSLVSLITALIVIFVVFGDALATRMKERR
jgi:ABC-type uncharacterized transport system permease subunit